MICTITSNIHNGDKVVIATKDKNIIGVIKKKTTYKLILTLDGKSISNEIEIKNINWMARVLWKYE